MTVGAQRSAVRYVRLISGTANTATQAMTAMSRCQRSDMDLTTGRTQSSATILTARSRNLSDLPFRCVTSFPSEKKQSPSMTALNTTAQTTARSTFAPSLKNFRSHSKKDRPQLLTSVRRWSVGQNLPSRVKRERLSASITVSFSTTAEKLKEATTEQKAHFTR